MLTNDEDDEMLIPTRPQLVRQNGRMSVVDEDGLDISPLPLRRQRAYTGPQTIYQLWEERRAHWAHFIETFIRGELPYDFEQQMHQDTVAIKSIHCARDAYTQLIAQCRRQHGDHMCLCNEYETIVNMVTLYL